MARSLSLVWNDWHCLFVSAGASVKREPEALQQAIFKGDIWQAHQSVKRIISGGVHLGILDHTVLFRRAEPAGMGNKELVADPLCRQS